MNWPSSGSVVLITVFILVVCYAVSVEKRIAKGEIPLVPYSFKQTWRFGGIATAVSTLLAILIYWRTGDSSFALSWLVILMVLSCAGLLRGLLAEYQHKRRGGKNLDEKP
ncbi:MAG: hypothetical protein Q8O35_11470 [Humidesulfovibrio sp.]|uniref:hypothetical protein n=1 Tax=Humidesulfovibrio sp. TaxID=2910988 RepID=UPI002734C1BC|nr:hypothetical protein [Humidesulfovibrio sp.]MDP2848792.1 hypothetical protein [Humidesulfovibrio sp.]